MLRRSARGSRSVDQLEDDAVLDDATATSVASDGQGEDPSQRAEDSRLQAQWTGGSALATRASTAVLWTAMAAGPVALLLAGTAALSSSAPAVQPVAPVVDRAGEQAAAGEFAGRLVRLWLTGVRGQEAQVTALVPGARLVLPEVGWTTGPATVADARRHRDGTWTVVTALTVNPPSSPAAGGAAAAGNAGAPPVPAPVRFFAVPVRVAPTGLVALTLPAPVPGPVVAVPPRLGYRYAAALTDPLVVSVGQFLEALLTGTGDVTRYVSPGTPIRPVTPALYSAVQVTEVASDTQLPDGGAVPADGTRVRVLVDATATGLPEQRAGVQYLLRLAVRGGRWEVTELDPAPAVQRATTPPGASAPASRSGSAGVPAAPLAPAAPAAPAQPSGLSTTPPNPLD